MITEQYGAAASLLVKIKDFVSLKGKQQQKGNGHVSKTAILSIRQKKWQREVRKIIISIHIADAKLVTYMVLFHIYKQAAQKSGHAPDFLTKIINEIGLENYKVRRGCLLGKGEGKSIPHLILLCHINRS